MSEGKSRNLMDIVPGGENTPYESSTTFVDPDHKAEGQFGDSTTSGASEQGNQKKTERGEKTAQNIRFGQSISDNGFGAETTGNGGVAQQQGYGIVEDKGAEKTSKARQEAGYGESSDVGA